MKSIPRFSHEEAGDIEPLLVNKGIPFECEGVIIRASTEGGSHEYLFHIPDDFYSSAIEVIREYYGLNPSPYDKQGYEFCPACNSKIINPKECSQCGLSLSYNPEETMKDHPFYIYLKQQNIT